MKKRESLSESFIKCGLDLHVVPDEDGLYNGHVSPPSHSLFFWSLAWIGLISGIYALFVGYYDLSLVPLGIWLTSINYWRRPVLTSWRRYIDIGYVNIALFYQLFRARFAEHAIIYYSVTVVTLLFFPLSWYLHNRKLIVIATLCHGMVHILGNVGNFILYSGYIPDEVW